MNSKSSKKVKRLAESAVLLAFATVLYFVKIIDMPFGGEITLFSMLPIFIVAYRYSVRWGLLTGFCFSVIQLFLGMKNLQFATSAKAAVAIVLLDYIIAYTLLGLGGLFKNKIKNQTLGLSLGIGIACGLRFVCHIISGCTVWEGVSIPSSQGIIYSVAYNLAYMFPEAVICIAGGIIFSKIFDFRSEKLTRRKNSSSTAQIVISIVSTVILTAVLTFDVTDLFFTIQTDSGYSISNLKNADFTLIFIVTFLGIAICGILFIINQIIKKRMKKTTTNINIT